VRALRVDRVAALPAAVEEPDDAPRQRPVALGHRARLHDALA